MIPVICTTVTSASSGAEQKINSIHSHTQYALVCCVHLMVFVDAQISLPCRSDTWMYKMTQNIFKRALAD